LYDQAGALVTQADAAAAPATPTWQSGAIYPQRLALPIPLAIRPGIYQLKLVVYAQADATALPIQGGIETLLELGEVQIAQTDEPVYHFPSLARFDYIDLVDVQPHQQTLPPEATFQVTLIWQPQASAYTDTFRGTLLLQNQAGEFVQEWSDVLGGWNYPSGEWLTGAPVLDQRLLTLSPTVPSGEYTLRLRVTREQDERVIPAHTGWFASNRESMAVGRIIVVE